MKRLIALLATLMLVCSTFVIAQEKGDPTKGTPEKTKATDKDKKGHKGGKKGAAAEDKAMNKTDKGTPEKSKGGDKDKDKDQKAAPKKG